MGMKKLHITEGTSHSRNRGCREGISVSPMSVFPPRGRARVKLRRARTTSKNSSASFFSSLFLSLFPPLLLFFFNFFFVPPRTWSRSLQATGPSICRSFRGKHVATISRYVALATSLQRPQSPPSLPFRNADGFAENPRLQFQFGGYMRSTESRQTHVLAIAKRFRSPFFFLFPTVNS